MIVTEVDSLDQLTGALFYRDHAQWWWDGKTMRPINALAETDAHD